MIQQRPSKAERKFSAWFTMLLGGAGAIAASVDLLAAHLLGWFGPMQGVKGDSIGLAASLFLFALGRFGVHSSRR